MKDVVKELKFDDMNKQLVRYKKYMCYNCEFFKDELCTKNRILRVCAKKGLKNRN